MPRNRVLRDETLADLAIHPPKTVEDLMHVRNMPEDVARGKFGRQLMEAVKKGVQTPKDECPEAPERVRFSQELTPVLEMLKMLLRIQASEHEVAAKLIASGSHLEELAMDDNAQIPALKGWRYDVFGKEALALKKGKIALGLTNNRIDKRKV